MTELAFIVDTRDAALPAGRGAAAVSSDAAGGFSGLLGERLQAGLAGPSQAPPPGAARPAPAAAQAARPVPESGTAAPVAGSPLPLLDAYEAVSPQDPLSAGFAADAALLAAITQSAPRAQPTTVATADSLETPATAEVLAADGLLNTLSGTLPAGQTVLPTAQPTGAAVLAPLDTAAGLARPFLPVAPQGLAAEKQDARPDNGRMQALNITPALLAQPVSESAHRALVLAMNEAGLGQRVAPVAAGQAEASPALNARQSGLAPLPNGLMAAMQWAGMTPQAVSAKGFEPGAASRLVAPQPAAFSAVTPLPTASGAEGISSLLPLGASLSSSSSLGAGFMPTLPVSTPVGQAGWANELGQRVAWLAQGELREAQLQLHPRSLGPVEVRIAYGHEQQLNVSFTAANPLAREALDAALPRLREMFEQQGLTLADANISQHSFADQRQQQGEEGDTAPRPGTWSSEVDSLTEQATVSNVLLMGRGMLDAYA
ncbi:MAG: flagellar hook-length control protein FliK [Gammaproteobacteria bacterium]|nr:flagellar hook-length control protein FliK [Gammaproteobacteria bacterium]